ncbi:MAG: hypothetical protein QM758_22310 [Armatimonas sp.]
MKRKQAHALLEAAQANGALIRLTRSFDTEEILGYVVGLSEDWVLLHTIVECRFDGWTALRIGDITQSVEDNPTSFVQRLHKRRGQRAQSLPTLKLSSVSSLLSSAHRIAPLVQIELETLWPDTSYIGRVKRVGKRQIRLNIANSQAIWEASAGSYPLRKITKICLKNDYCLGLWEMLSERHD